MNHRLHWRIVVLVVVTVIAAGFGSWSAVRLDKTYAACGELQEVVRQQNVRGDVLQRLLTNAAEAREATALLPNQSADERRISQRAAYLYRLDIDLIKPTDELDC